MSKTLCDDYFIYAILHKKGSKLALITGKSSGARAGGIRLPSYEEEDGVPIHRVYNNPQEMFMLPRRRLKNVLKIATELNPDLIYCHSADNVPLALLLRKYFKIPIVLHVEIAGAIPTQKFVGSWKMRTLRLLLRLPTKGPAHWSWLCKNTDAIITSNPPDQRILASLSRYGAQVYYLPWPANIPVGCQLQQNRNKERGIFAGLLVPFKNTQEFEWVLPLILQKTPIKEFIIIGIGSHSAIINKLKLQFGDAIRYIPKLPRCEVIRLISGSYFAFTPVQKGGWGFIGDCWAVETPLLMFNNIFLSKELDPCVAKTGEDLVQKINQLYEDPPFYRKLQSIGNDEYKKRTTEAVTDKLYDIFSKTLKNFSASEEKTFET